MCTSRRRKKEEEVQKKIIHDANWQSSAKLCNWQTVHVSKNRDGFIYIIRGRIVLAGPYSISPYLKRSLSVLIAYLLTWFYSVVIVCISYILQYPKKNEVLIDHNGRSI